MLDRLIVMDDVSDLADRSETFINFLTISRKYGLTCVYIFHTIYQSRQNCQMILSQTKILKTFFPAQYKLLLTLEFYLLFVVIINTLTTKKRPLH